MRATRGEVPFAGVVEHIGAGRTLMGYIGKGKIKWQENVKFVWRSAAKNGTFSGIESRWDNNNERLLAKASGNFSCVRLVAVL